METVCAMLPTYIACIMADTVVNEVCVNAVIIPHAVTASDTFLATTAGSKKVRVNGASPFAVQATENIIVPPTPRKNRIWP